MGEDGFRVTWSSQEGWFSTLQYWSMFTQLHVSQYHPVKDSDRNRPQYSVWCLARIRIKDVGNQKPNLEFQTRLALAMAQRMLPKFSRFSSHHHRLHKRLKDMTASRVSFQCCYCDRRALSSLFWPPTPSFLQGKGSFVCISHAVSDARVIPGPTLSSAGFHKSRAAAATAVTTTENVIYSKHWKTTSSSTGPQLCRPRQWVGSTAKGETTDMIMLGWKKQTHPNTSYNHQLWLARTYFHLLSPTCSQRPKRPADIWIKERLQVKALLIFLRSSITDEKRSTGQIYCQL